MHEVDLVDSYVSSPVMFVRSCRRFFKLSTVEFSKGSHDFNENIVLLFAISLTFQFHRNIQVKQADLGISLNAAAGVAE